MIVPVLPRTVAHWLAALFCIYAAIAVPGIALLMPPFQAADELAHTQRADEIAGGQWLATRFNGDASSGGPVDPGLERLAGLYDGLRFHPEVRQTPAMAVAAATLRPGPRRPASFPNTAIYPPTFYLPAALGQALGRVFGLRLTHVLLLSRLLQGLASVATGALAIALAGGAAPLLFAVLCLPMSLALFASTSQDGPMIAAAALGAVLLGRPSRGRSVMGCCALLAAVAMARPAYLPLCLLPLLPRPNCAPFRARLAGAAAAVGATLLWTLLAGRVSLYRPSAEQVARQIHALWRHPGIVPTLVRTTVQTQWRHGSPYGQELIGVLGWLDTTLPLFFYALTGAMLLVALALSRPAGPAVPGATRSGTLLLALSAMAAVFAFQYLSWSPIGGPLIEGVQGRYFLPLLPILVLALPGREGTRGRSWLTRPVPLALFSLYPALTVVVTIRAIVLRYGA